MLYHTTKMSSESSCRDRNIIPWVFIVDPDTDLFNARVSLTSQLCMRVTILPLTLSPTRCHLSGDRQTEGLFPCWEQFQIKYTYMYTAAPLLVPTLYKGHPSQ